MRLALVALTVVLAALPAAVAAEPQFIEAYCDGGIDGRYQHARVEADGTIRASNRHDTPQPWPVVATEPEAAQRWFAAIEAAAPLPTATPPEVVVADGITCGLELGSGEERARYDLPDVHREIVVHVPGYH